MERVAYVLKEVLAFSDTPYALSERLVMGISPSNSDGLKVTMERKILPREGNQIQTIKPLGSSFSS
jgi:hypothetical protein